MKSESSSSINSRLNKFSFCYDSQSSKDKNRLSSMNKSSDQTEKGLYFKKAQLVINKESPSKDLKSKPTEIEKNVPVI